MLLSLASVAKYLNQVSLDVTMQAKQHSLFAGFGSALCNFGADKAMFLHQLLNYAESKILLTVPLFQVVTFYIGFRRRS